MDRNRRSPPLNRPRSPPEDRRRPREEAYRPREEAYGRQQASQGRGSYRGGRGDYGRGGRDRGRGDQRGRGPRVPPMAESAALLRAMSSSPEMTDDAILRVINPPFEARFRDELMGPVEIVNVSTTTRRPVSNRWMPTLTLWRAESTLGIKLDETTGIVRCNYFKIHPEDLPDQIFQYDLKILLVKQEEEGVQDLVDIDLSSSDRKGFGSAILRELLNQHPEWIDPSTGQPIGRVYDGTREFYITVPLSVFTGSDNFTCLMPDPTSTSQKRRLFQVNLTLVATIHPPQSNAEWRENMLSASEEIRNRTHHAQQALDIATMSFALSASQSSNLWFVDKNKAFRADGEVHDLGAGFLARVGYKASVKACLAGLCLVTDISLACFLKGGPVTEIMAVTCGFRDERDMLQEIMKHGITPQLLNEAVLALKSCMMLAVHLGYSKKFKRFGPAANSPESAFEHDGKIVTVDEYFCMKAESDPRYERAMGGKRLRYPFLPTMDFGSKTKRILIPMELLRLVEGQTRANVRSEIKDQLIRYAAKPPADRFRALNDASSIIASLQQDLNASQFGLHTIDHCPMRVDGFILPSPVLLYNRGQVNEPGLKGVWNLKNLQFYKPAENPDYGLVVVYRGKAQVPESSIGQFQRNLEAEARNLGLQLRCVHSQPIVCYVDEPNLNDVFRDLKGRGARLVVVIILEDIKRNKEMYNLVKLTADSIALPTQCVPNDRIRQAPPRQYEVSLLIKINTKLGGVNHVLAPRSGSESMSEHPGKRQRAASLKAGKGTEEGEEGEIFQVPRNSNLWIFDEPCMIVGVDASYPDPGRDGPSVVSVVASMDGMLSHYAQYTYCSHGRGSEPIHGLDEAFASLLNSFIRSSNGKMPTRIIIFRDGVADNQFDQILQIELEAFKGVLAEKGYNEDSLPIAMIVCQKRHNTRLVYQQFSDSLMANPCVGVCVDGRGDLQGSVKGNGPDTPSNICTPGLVEFYLNSHAAIQGTSRPCRYVLLYDEIGLKLIEIELLIFWETHLYSRCTKSVSYAKPAYYAHLAAKRGRTYLSAGATSDRVRQISNTWLQEQGSRSLYYL